MQAFSLRMPNGDVAPFRRNDSGEWLCPICGEPDEIPYYWYRDIPIGSDVKATKEPYAICTRSSEECPECETVFGYQEGVTENAPSGRTFERWEERRILWLNKIHWPQWALERLQNALDVDICSMKSKYGIR